MSIDPDVQHYADTYYDYNNISTSRQWEMNSELKKYRTFVNMPIREAGRDEFQAYALMIVKVDRNSASTTKKRLARIKAFYSWMFENEIISADVLLRIRAVKPPRGHESQPPQPYSPAKLRAVRDAIDAAYPRIADRHVEAFKEGTLRYDAFWRHATNAQLRAMFWLHLHTAMRPGEARRMLVEDVLPGNEYIVVRGAAKGANFGKDMRRQAYWTTETRDSVAEWLRLRKMILRFLKVSDHGRLWLRARPDMDLGRMPINPLYSPADAPPPELYAIWAGELGISWRLMRHTGATEWLRAGMPLEAVSRLVGHSNVQQTMTYAQVVDADVQKHVERTVARFQKRILAA